MTLQIKPKDYVGVGDRCTNLIEPAHGEGLVLEVLKALSIPHAKVQWEDGSVRTHTLAILVKKL
jgi:hypothetical protein